MLQSFVAPTIILAASVWIASKCFFESGAVAAFGNSVFFFNGNSCQMIGACIFMTENET